MNFFQIVHRSIVDPSVYREIATFSKKSVIGFLLKLLLFSSVVIGVAQTCYILGKNSGIAVPLETVFSGMELVNGTLEPHRPLPYIPPSYQMIPLLDRLLGVSLTPNSNLDSIVIFDTTNTSNYPLKVPVALLKKNALFIVLSNKHAYPLPYSALFFGEKNLKFNAQDIRTFLKSHITAIFVNCFFTSFFRNLFVLIFSIVFLATAAFIFRVEKKFKYLFYIKVACFAVTPISIGTVVVALSGVRVAWTWQLLILISTIVMFRALVASIVTTNKPGEEI